MAEARGPGFHGQKPAVGDLAWHLAGAKPRTVTRVEGDSIYFSVGSTEIGPKPASHYTFSAPPRKRS